MAKQWFQQVLEGISTFRSAGGKGADPFAKIYEARRAEYSLFTPQMGEDALEKLRGYIFCYDKLPSLPSDAPVPTYNFIDGQWCAARAGTITMSSPADNRIKLAQVPDSKEEDCEAALAAADRYWRSLKWAEENLVYRKHVIKNFSRMLNYFYEDCLKEIRTVIPKTRLESDKDFWEAKRAADHLEGSAERVMSGTRLPTLIDGHSYWKNEYIPGGIASIVTPMNFIYGIPIIHLAGCYLTGAPFIFKGHPFGAICNTTMIRMMLAAGAHPDTVQKVEGFGGNVEKLVSDPRVAVTVLTGSDETAAHFTRIRGLRPTKFEGGGCNWSFVDEGFSDEELKRIAVRLTYSKLGFSSHKCTTLHGIAAAPATLKKVLDYVSREMDEWQVKNPTLCDATETKVVGPCMVHKAQTAQDIQDAAEKAGATVVRRGGKLTDGLGLHGEYIKPIVLGGLKPGFKVTVNWDGKGERNIDLTTTEFFMPILAGMEVRNFDAFTQFCLFHNNHDLAVSLWSRDDRKLVRARHMLSGMLKENDGTDSALEWEEFGAGGMGTSGNMGVGDPEATFQIYCRRQKGRHVVF